MVQKGVKMENLENNSTNRPVRPTTARPTVNSSTNATPNPTVPVRRVAQPVPKPVVEYHNPKFWTIILMILSVLGLVCFFCLPVYYKYEKIIDKYVIVKFVDLLKNNGALAVAVRCVLTGYIFILLNCILNIWHGKNVNQVVFFTICNFLAICASLLSFISGIYFIVNRGYTPIAMLTIVLLTVLVVCQILGFWQCKEIKDINAKTYGNSKPLTIINIILVLITFGMTILFYFSYINDLISSLSILWCLIAVYIIINNIVLLASKKVSSSKNGYVSKMVIAVFTIFNIVLNICVFISLFDTDFNGFFQFLYAVNVLVSFLLVMLSLAQAFYNPNKKLEK